MSFWDSEEQLSEREMLEDQDYPQRDGWEGSFEDSNQYVESEDDLDEYVEEETHSHNVKIPYKNISAKEKNIINEAMVRLEQARLYEMLIKHNLFEGVKAHPEALKNVEREIKDYIVQRLEVLMGMKKETSPERHSPVDVSIPSPFNDVEIEFLKELAYKGTKGESSRGKTVVQTSSGEFKPVGQSVIKPLQSSPQYSVKPIREEVKNNTVKPISSAPANRVPIPEKRRQEPVPQQKRKSPPPQKRRQVPVQQSSSNKTISKFRKDGSRKSEREIIEEIAKKELIESRNRKSIDKMSAAELEERNKTMGYNQRGKPTNPLPMPGSDQMASHYMMNKPQDSGDGGFGNILASALSKSKGGNGIVFDPSET